MTWRVEARNIIKCLRNGIKIIRLYAFMSIIGIAGEKSYYLLTVVVGECKGVTQVALRAYSNKTHGQQGFLNKIVASVRHLVVSMQSQGRFE